MSKKLESHNQRYARWSSVPDHLKTKTQLKQMRLKPLDVRNYQATVKVYQYSSWREFELYDISLTKPVKSRKEANIDDIELTQTSIAEALYVINKSAKRSRDTKTRNYNRGNHYFVNKAKERQNELYALKEDAIDTCIDDEIAEVLGYHSQKNVISHTIWVDTDEMIEKDTGYDNDFDPEDDEVRYYRERQTEYEVVTNYFLLVNIADFTFHLPLDKSQIEHYDFLGEIERISAEKTRKTTIKFNQAVKLLNKLIGA